MLESLIWKTIPDSRMSFYRSVSFDRLPAIIRNGCDVEPVQSPLYATPFLDKALEYGCEGDQVIQLFRLKALTKTWQQVKADIAPEKLAALRKTYPTVLHSTDRQTIWLSRLAEDDPRLASPYETEYGYWISGDPFDAMAGLAIIGDGLKRLVSQTKTLIGKNTNKGVSQKYK